MRNAQYATRIAQHAIRNAQYATRNAKRNPFASSIASYLANELDRMRSRLQLAILAIDLRTWKRLEAIEDWTLVSAI